MRNLFLKAFATNADKNRREKKETMTSLFSALSLEETNQFKEQQKKERALQLKKRAGILIKRVIINLLWYLLFFITFFTHASLSIIEL